MQPNGSMHEHIMTPNDSINQEVNMMFFQRLEDMRIDRDLSQSDVARILGCQREVYRRYEKGTRTIPVDFLIKLADYYNVSIDYLVGRTKNKAKY